jgi:hypothetical protein
MVPTGSCWAESVECGCGANKGWRIHRQILGREEKDCMKGSIKIQSPESRHSFSKEKNVIGNLPTLHDSRQFFTSCSSSAMFMNSEILVSIFTCT